jgi:hypothetical protein
MPVTASGIVSLPLENLRILVANCDAFQTWTESADVATAKTRLHLIAPLAEDGRKFTAEELASLRPFAVIDEWRAPGGRQGGGSWVMDRHALGGYTPSGKLILTFEDAVADEDKDNHDEARLQFMNQLGAVLNEMLDLGGGDTDYLSIHRIERWDFYARSDETEKTPQGDFYWASYLIDWGV